MAFKRVMRKKNVSKKTKYVKKSSGLSVASVAKICKRVVSRTEEKKQLNYNIAPGSVVSAYGGTIWVTQTGVFPLSPYGSYLDCVQGTAQNQRIGNRITITNAVLKLMFNPFPYDVTFNPLPAPLEISILLLYQRQDPINAPSSLPGLYQDGGSAAQPTTTGLVYDTMKPFNTDRWRVFKRKTFKLGFANYGGTGTNAALQSDSNNDFKLNQKITINYTKYLNKRVRYDDTTANPQTRGLFLVILVHSADGRALSNTNKYAYVNGCMKIEYTDA